MLKKLYLNLRIFFHYLFQGMKSADNIIGGVQKDNELSVSDGTEETKEQHNVLDDLLRGVVTEEVKELRYETYLAAEKSRNYEKNTSNKLNMFSKEHFVEGLENSENLPILIIQDNKEDIKTMEDLGIHIGWNGNKEIVVVDKDANVGNSTNRKFTIEIKRDYNPRFKLENYTRKIVVKDNGDSVILDLYIPLLRDRYDNKGKFFYSELVKVHNKETYRSEIIDFDNLSFVAYGAFGSADLIKYNFTDVKFKESVIYKDSYVFKFTAKQNKDDLTKDFYHEATQEKIDKKEIRKGAILDYGLYVESEELGKQINVDEFKNVMNSLKKENEEG